MIADIFVRIGYAAISLFILTNYGLLLIGSMARISAKVQGRVGQPVWQPYIDIIKSIAKRNSIGHGVMFYLGPVFRLAGGIGTYMFIPAVFGSVLFRNFSDSGDLLLVMYFIFFGQLGMALGASEGGHPYSALGVSRGLAQMTAFEVPFALSVIAVVIQYGTLDITAIVAAQQGGFLNWTLFTNPLAVLAAMIAFLGMSGHNPFSVVLAPQEIPIGPPTEYHSNLLGMLQTNRAVFNGAKLVLYMNLFFGGATNIVIMVIKTFLIYFINIFVGQAFPRFRTDQSIRFFLGVPTVVGIISVIIAVL
ncbi:MAG: NADH-quinone oxidoreductase subunit H [Spirochaetes bacterium]|nr:NADH-quinone oxidoreductase subunit H [Spirochaetota bacterium]MBU0957049.1 NADH-quinone oxidoreductase subunit H [Spirochaetota bacterium]